MVTKIYSTKRKLNSKKKSLIKLIIFCRMIICLPMYADFCERSEHRRTGVRNVKKNVTNAVSPFFSEGRCVRLD